MKYPLKSSVTVAGCAGCITCSADLCHARSMPPSVRCGGRGVCCVLGEALDR